MAGIPRRLGHIWIGPKPAPVHWMDTWPEKHPDWDYRVYDNEFLMEFPFRNRRLINEYFWRAEYAGVQDLIRYEILHAFGGFMADADAICMHPVDELLPHAGAYTVYDRDVPEGRGVSPFLACEPGNPLLAEVIDRLSKLEPWQLRQPFHSTGNLFLMSLIREWGEEKVTIFPSHYFIPWHHGTPDKVYSGPDRVYAEQMWGTATFRYNRADGEGNEAVPRSELAERARALRHQLALLVQPDLKIGELTGAAVRPADAAADRVLKGEAWAQRLPLLNTALTEAMAEAGHEPRFGGNGFYRHMQGQPMEESGLMSRGTQLRARVATWLAGAKSVMQIGVDSGHMLLMSRLLNPDARIVAFDACTRLSPNAPQNEVYTPAAIKWFGKDAEFLTGRPARVIAALGRAEPDLRLDVLHFNGIDQNFLKSFGAARGMLAPDALILINDMDAARVVHHVEELQMIGEVAEPVEMSDFGPMRGGLAVLRLSS